MTTTWREKIVCVCGHEGEHVWSENDQPFSSQWERHRFNGFDGGEFETSGTANLRGAITAIKPKCPQCGAVGQVTYATKS